MNCILIPAIGENNAAGKCPFKVCTSDFHQKTKKKRKTARKN